MAVGASSPGSAAISNVGTPGIGGGAIVVIVIPGYGAIAVTGAEGTTTAEFSGTIPFGMAFGA